VVTGEFRHGARAGAGKWAVSFVDVPGVSFPGLGHCEPKALERLSPEQQKAVESVLASKDQVVCLRGAAGVGKTTSFERN